MSQQDLPKQSGIAPVERLESFCIVRTLRHFLQFREMCGAGRIHCASRFLVLCETGSLPVLISEECLQTECIIRAFLISESQQRAGYGISRPRCNLHIALQRVGFQS